MGIDRRLREALDGSMELPSADILKPGEIEGAWDLQARVYEREGIVCDEDVTIDAQGLRRITGVEGRAAHSVYFASRRPDDTLDATARLILPVPEKGMGSFQFDSSTIPEEHNKRLLRLGCGALMEFASFAKDEDAHPFATMVILRQAIRFSLQNYPDRSWIFGLNATILPGYRVAFGGALESLGPSVSLGNNLHANFVPFLLNPRRAIDLFQAEGSTERQRAYADFMTHGTPPLPESRLSRIGGAVVATV